MGPNFMAVVYGTKDKIEALIVAHQLAHGNLFSETFPNIRRSEEIPETEFLATSIKPARHFIFIEKIGFRSEARRKIWDGFFELAKTMGLSGEQIEVGSGPKPKVECTTFGEKHDYLFLKPTIAEAFPDFETKTFPVKVI